MQQYRYPARCHIQQVDTILAVGINNLFAVRAPVKGPDIGIVILRQLHRIAFDSILEIKFRLAGSIRDVSDELTVRRPLGITFVCTGSTGDIFRHTLCSWNVEHLAARRNRYPFSVRRSAGGSQVLRTFLDGSTGIDIIRSQDDIYFFRPTGRSIHLIDVSTILKYNRIAGSTREFDIVLGEVGYLFRLPGLCVVNENIHRAVAVGNEKDVITNPHGENVLSNVVRDVFYRLFPGIINPDIISHTTFVVFPGAEFAHGTIVGQLLPIWRVTAETALGQRDGIGQSAFLVHGIELA